MNVAAVHFIKEIKPIDKDLGNSKTAITIYLY